MIMFGRVRALIAVRNEIGASRTADGGIGTARNSEISKILQTPVSHGQRAFWRNGALSGTTAGVTFANDVELFDWLNLDGPLHSNANRYILFSYGGTLHFRVRKYRPQNGSPRKICRGVLVIRPKKLMSSELVGPELLFEKWVAPANLPGDVGGKTQKADIHQVVYPGKKQGVSTLLGVALVRPKRWTHFEKKT
jgi:hypothetical protein